MHISAILCHAEHKKSIARDLCAILLSLLLVKGFGRSGLNQLVDHAGMYVYIDALTQILMYLLLILFTKKHLRIKKRDMLRTIGKINCRRTAFAAGLGLALFAFAHGQNGVETWLLSQLDPHFAYSVWAFKEESVPAWNSVEGTFILHLCIGTIVAPIAEEYFFRGLLFPAFGARTGILRGSLASALVFIIAHLQHPHIVSTLLFSVSLAYLYVATQSIALCVLAHSAFNLSAIISENLLFEFLVHPRAEIHLLQNWKPELFLWLASLIILFSFFYRYRHVIYQANMSVSPTYRAVGFE